MEQLLHIYIAAKRRLAEEGGSPDHTLWSALSVLCVTRLLHLYKYLWKRLAVPLRLAYIYIYTCIYLVAFYASPCTSHIWALLPLKQQSHLTTCLIIILLCYKSVNHFLFVLEACWICRHISTPQIETLELISDQLCDSVDFSFVFCLCVFRFHGILSAELNLSDQAVAIRWPEDVYLVIWSDLLRLKFHYHVILWSIHESPVWKTISSGCLR